VKRALLLALAVALLAGCGDDSTSDTTTTASEKSTVRVYFLRDGKVWPVAREVEPSPDLLNAAYQAVREGPTQEERDIGLTTEVPRDPSGRLSRAALAQVVFTVTQFAPHSAEYKGVNYTRADFEDQTPGILVESPLPFAEVAVPITASGTANTFEATFNYELVAPNGAVVSEEFVTATSGTGTRGTFEFTTDALDQPAEGEWKLRVFERSAEDGSRTKLVEIPLRMSQ
jgi:germination protein M